jgi:WD repeat and SOF domain-containing protein 1
MTHLWRAEVKRIERHRHVPKSIHKAGKLRRIVADAAAVKQARRVAHAKEGAEKTKPARMKHAVNQEE